MSFPVIEDYATTLISTNETSHTLTLPDTYDANDLLVCFFTCDGSGVDLNISTGTGWVGLSISSGSGNTFGFTYKLLASDTSADNLIITTDSAQHSAAIIYAISGHASTKGLNESSDAGSSTNADPPSCTPTNGILDYLWIVCMATDGTVVASAAPSDFSDLVTNASGSSSDGVSLSTASRTYRTGSAYNPGWFTNATAAWSTITIIITSVDVYGFNINNLFLRFT